MSSTAGYSADDQLANLTSPYRRGAIPNNTKLANAFSTAVWTDARDYIDQMRIQMYPKTATGENLDRHAAFYEVLRKPSETDAQLRIRLAAKILGASNGVGADFITEMVEGITLGSPGDVVVTENTDPATGKHRPGFFYVEFDVDTLLSQGILLSQIPTVIAEIEDLLNKNSAAGVRGAVLVTGGAEWDVDSWDDPDAFWGAAS